MKKFERLLIGLLAMVLILPVNLGAGGTRPQEGQASTRLVVEEKPRFQEENRFLISDFLSPGDLLFKLEGQLNKEDYQKIRGLEFRGEDRKIYLGKKPLENSNYPSTIHWEEGEILISLDPETSQEFSQGADLGDWQGEKTAAGQYRIFLEMEAGFQALDLAVAGEEGTYEYMDILDRPYVIASQPRKNEKYLNPQDLWEGFSQEEEGYYLWLDFTQLASLDLIQEKNDGGIVVRGLADDRNLIDPKKRLILKANRLYLPLREKLEDGKDYQLSLAPGQYIGYQGFRDPSGGNLNKGYRMNFSTRSQPQLVRLYEGSVGEDYDPSYPIIIDGLDINPGTELIFKQGRKSYYPDRIRMEDLDQDLTRLYIYLPRKRLPLGNYSLILSNGRDHQQEQELGSFSVIARGTYLEADLGKKYDKKLGALVYLRSLSRNQLELEEPASILHLDLDQELGQAQTRDLLIRAGDYQARRDIRIYSQDFQLDLLGLEPLDRQEDIVISLGETSPLIGGQIKNLLGSQARSLNSKIIEIGGQNYSLDYLRLGLNYSYQEAASLSRPHLYREEAGIIEEIQDFDSSQPGQLSLGSQRPGIYFISY